MKKSFIYILIIFSLISQNIFADTLFQNDIKNITFTKNSIGKPEINITLDKNETINVIKKDDLEYVILMPETSSSLKGKPSLDKVSDVITGIDIKTQPYAKNIKGYTKITIRTTKPLSLNTKTTAYKPNTNVQKQPVKQPVKTDVIAQQTPKLVIKPVTKQEVKPDVSTSKQIAQTPKQDMSTYKPNGKSLFNKDEPDIVIYPVQKAEKPKTTTKKDIKPETNENIKTAEKVSQPKPVVNKTQKQDAPEKTEPKVQQPTVVKEETEEIIPTTQPSEPEVKAPEQVKKAEPAKPVKKSKSLFTSIFITGVLLLLLLFLKLLNKKAKYIKLQDVIAKNTDDNSENPQEEIVQEEINNLYGEEQVSKPRFTPPEEIIMPVHESFEHNTILNEEEIPNEEILSELETSEEYNEPQEVIQENIDIPVETEEPEIIPPVTLQQEEIVQEETVQEEIVQEETQTEEISASTENYAYQSIQEPLANTTFETVDTTIDVEDSFNENFNENVSVDDVFGVFDDEQETSKNLVNNTEAQEEIPMNNISEESTLNENTVVYKNTENVEVETAGESDVASENKIQTECEIQEENNIVTESEENASETEETQPEEETEVVQDSYNFTPTKSIYLINYEGVSILMASIKDEFFVLKKFDEIIDKPLMVRQTEKNSKKTTYIVRIGSFRGVIEVTLKNLEMVLEL